MEVSHEVTSMVRRWVRTSPAAKTTLSRSPNAPAFSPRPERLGLGATPHQDTKEEKAKRKLDSRIQRKISGKRKRRLEADLPLSKLDKLSESSGDECSRSAIEHRGRGGALGTVSGKRRRKRKRKRKTGHKGDGDCDGNREGLTGDKEACLRAVDGVTTRPVLRGGGSTCNGGGSGRQGGAVRGRKRKRGDVKWKQSLTTGANNLIQEVSTPDSHLGQGMTGLVAGSRGTLDCESSHAESHRTDKDQPLTDPGLEASGPLHSPVTRAHKRHALRRRWVWPHSTPPFSRRRRTVRFLRVS